MKKSNNHGGKRKGAGRKKGRFVKTQKAEPTKTKRIPIAIEDVIDSIIDQHKKRIMATKLDLADAQFIGFCHGKDQNLMGMVQSMGLTKEEWLKWKVEYSTNYLTDNEINEINEHFNLPIDHGKQGT